jgi:hypothetical protein
MCRNTVAIHSVFKKNYKTKFSTSSILKKIKTIKTILNKKHKKMGKKKEENNFGKKAKKIEKKTCGEIHNCNYQPAQYSKQFDKDNFEKKHVGKHCRKTKIMRGNIVTFQYFKEKNYEAKLTKII